MKITLKHKIAALATAATIVGGSGVALAYWTSTGNGAGSATAGTSSPWVVTTDAATGGLLTPDGPTQTVGFHVQNVSSGVQGLQAVAVKVANANGSAWDPTGDCDASDFVVGIAAAGGTHTISYSQVENVAAGGTKSGSVTIKMINKTTTNQDSCKGVAVPLHLAAS